jgi:hypothetical protein
MLAIEERKLFLDERKSDYDMDLRRRELEIKQRESGWASKFFSPLTTTLLAGVLTLAGSVVGTVMQGRQTLQLEEQKFKTTKALEEEKFDFSKQMEVQKQQHDLIVKMISVGDEKQARHNIKFPADMGLISDPELTKRLLAAPTVGVLPPPNAIPVQIPSPVPSISGLTESAASAQRLYEEPALTFDPGIHTASINSIDVDAPAHFAVTGSDDKTIRVWSVADGQLVRTIYVPEGPGNVGKIYAVAMSPEGGLLAAGGWTGWTTKIPEASIYLFDKGTGKMTSRIAGLPDVIHRLVFSPDGRYLAAGLSGSNGLRIYDRDRQWAEAFRDTDYGAVVHGIAFSADGRLATTSYDGKVRLYDRNFKLAGPPKETTIGTRPFGIAFSPDGSVLAVGFNDVPRLNLLDGHNLASVRGPNTDGMTKGSLGIVGWSRDGQTLYAGGHSSDAGNQLLVA